MATERVHQIIVGASKHDAITAMSLEIQKELAKYFESNIYCYHPVPPDFPSFVKQLPELDSGSHDDVLVYHLSFGISEITRFLLNRAEKIVLAYHNVTPDDFYAELLPEFADALKYGRSEPGLLLSRTSLAIADSLFNASELTKFGYTDVHVVPGGVNPHRLAEIEIDLDFLVELESQFPEGYIVFVSQVLPHKRVDHAIEILHLLRTIHQMQVGLVVAGPIRQPLYTFAIEKLKSRLDNSCIWLTDAISDQQLATLYRGCLCYIGTSEHEGLSVPPLEAMANRAPVVVLGAGAVPETVRDGGIVLALGTSLIEFAEVVAEVIQNENLRSHLRSSGEARLKEDYSTNPATRFVTLVRSVTV